MTISLSGFVYRFLFNAGREVRTLVAQSPFQSMCGW